MTVQNTPRDSSRPFGRCLEDLWLDGEKGKLHPAEWKLLDCAKRGVRCHLSDQRPMILTEENCLRAEFLRFLALGGDEKNPLHELGLFLSGGYVVCESVGLSFIGSDLPRELILFDCKIDGDVFMHMARARLISFEGSEIGAFFGDGLITTSSIYFRNGFRALGEVRLLSATLGGNLTCNGGSFENDNYALVADGLKVKGEVYLNEGFRAQGRVRFINANVGNSFNCMGGQFLKKEMSLCLQGARIGRDVELDGGFIAKGLVDLDSMEVGTNLDIKDAIFSSKNQSLYAPRIKIGGSVELGKNCRTAGQVSFQGAQIGGDMTFAGGSFEGKPAINLRNAKIEGTLFWRDVQHARGELNLSGASCRTLNMDWKSWEKPQQIHLDNFVYKGFSELPEGCNSQFWRDWLERQPDKYLTKRFRPNPYSQLGDVLEKMGFEQEAKSVRVEQRRRQSEFTRLYEPVSDNDTGRLMRKLTVFWNFVQGALVDYGYRPGKAMIFLVGVVLLGALIYHMAARDGIMAPTHPLIFKEAGNLFPKKCAENWVYFPDSVAAKCAAGVPTEYSEFSSLIYSLDVAIPVVNFRMENDWSPRVVTPKGERYWPGWWVRTWEWVQIALGWLLSLLFVSAIGGIIRR